MPTQVPYISFGSGEGLRISFRYHWLATTSLASSLSYLLMSVVMSAGEGMSLLDEPSMHRLGLAFVYRVVPVIVVSILYGKSRRSFCTLHILILAQVSISPSYAPPQSP